MLTSLALCYLSCSTIKDSEAQVRDASMGEVSILFNMRQYWFSPIVFILDHPSSYHDLVHNMVAEHAWNGMVIARNSGVSCGFRC